MREGQDERSVNVRLRPLFVCDDSNFIELMDVDLLISAVQQYPVLWDSTCDGYNKKNKNDAWVQVSKCLFKDFERKPKVNQILTVQEVTSKWRTVRDNYVRNLRRQDESSSDAKKVKNYLYSEQLSFLKKSLEPKVTISNMKIESDPLENSQNADGFDVEADCETGTNNETAIPSRKPKSSNKKKKMDVKRSSQSHKTQRITIEEDDDLAFFYSLMPTVKALTSDEKFTFRLQAMQLLQNIRQARLISPTYQNIQTRPQSTSSSSSS